MNIFLKAEIATLHKKFVLNDKNLRLWCGYNEYAKSTEQKMLSSTYEWNIFNLEMNNRQMTNVIIKYRG